jgi:signal transduction histidine kinase
MVTYANPDDRFRFQKEIEKKGSLREFEVRLLKKDGTEMHCMITASVRRADDGTILGYQGFIRDMTEHKKLEEQLIQAQKMEAIGTLAGGVAHDFNNILTSIIGYGELLSMDLPREGSMRASMEEINKAAKRAAALTRQLLVFSRRQVIQPDVLDLNEILTGTEHMLGRLIGEDIELVTIPGPALWSVEVDPGQIEQVIMNLAVNARDAMPQGGKLTIESLNVDLDAEFFRAHAVEARPGPYVMLAVSDTGKGMDRETLSHIFEPFFTTKERGRGTGLGLSTVYGIIKQSGGFIWAYSEPGEGTTFKIYLPTVSGHAGSGQQEPAPADKLKGSETLLIVEDDDTLRNLACKVLERRGYKVLLASRGEEALTVSEQYDGAIHLIVTDVVMPGMNGRELAENLQSLRPDMRVLYMSGYTDDAIVRHGVLRPGVNFIEKPCTPENLAQKVRKVLDKK